MFSFINLKIIDQFIGTSLRILWVLYIILCTRIYETHREYISTNRSVLDVLAFNLIITILFFLLFYTIYIGIPIYPWFL